MLIGMKNSKSKVSHLTIETSQQSDDSDGDGINRVVTSSDEESNKEQKVSSSTPNGGMPEESKLSPNSLLQNNYSTPSKDNPGIN